MKRKHDSATADFTENLCKKEKLSSLTNDELVDLISHLKHEYSTRMLYKLNNLPDEMIGIILSFLDRFEILSLGNLLFFKKWSKFIFHHDEYWRALFGELFPQVVYDFNLHNAYLLGRIRDFEKYCGIKPVMIEVGTGGGSEIDISRQEYELSFKKQIYYIEWPIEIPIKVKSYEGYNAQECETVTDAPTEVIGVYYSMDKPTKFYFSIKSEYESKRGESEYVDSTLIDIYWITSKGDIIDEIVSTNSANIDAVTKLLNSTLLEADKTPGEWIEKFIEKLGVDNWISNSFKLCSSDNNEEEEDDENED